MTRGLNEQYIHQMALCVQNHAYVLPNDISTEFPSYACLLGNLLETAGVAFSQPDSSFYTVNKCCDFLRDCYCLFTPYVNTFATY